MLKQKNNKKSDKYLTKQEIANFLIEQLPLMYPDAKCALNYRNVFELLVATILSAQCTDKQVNRVTPVLFARCATPEDFTKISSKSLEVLIHSTGFFHTKARNIQALSKILVEEYKGEVPCTMKELTALPGVGRKTANLVLNDGFDIRAGVVVDTHVGRLARRLGLTEARDPEKVERDLTALFPQKYWGLLSHWLIWHGRTLCPARAPRCTECPLALKCPKNGIISHF